MTNIIVENNMWYISHNGVDIYHHGDVKVGQQLTSSQPYFETFLVEQDYINRCNELEIPLHQKPII